ncbi:MAG: helix-turn-helix transcriptional regulator [Anaerolineae bacterium]|nr:helix-turn-helix transcriptional regulator [Anaerolineae bacterium]
MLAALTLYLANSIKKATTEEVAEHAGVTRVTVYRYFATKRELVRAAFQRSETVFEQARLALRDDQTADPIAVLEQIGRG